jgi:ABC-2 type transport system permease protein
MNPNVIFAIFRRNLLSYFSNPTGYVFICLFVVLCSLFAYWPYEFFNANLANLDQLNHYLPYIMLIFVPAITMGIWADERRQGTDELLLTIPATDLDVVLGKYLAAVGVFSVALLFSAICNFFMLHALGSPEIPHFFANYFGYWLVGLAMLATGMVASFFTSNLTVSFILGVLFNAPLVAADWADAFTGSPDWTLMIKHWGLAEQFRDFGRGVISLGSTVYFLMLVVVMLYLCMVLIGRRHWLGGRDGRSLFGHYLARASALIVIAAALNMVVEAFDLRYDVTAEKINSLSPDTVDLVRNLDTKNRPIVIEAYVSPAVPENYVQTRLNLLTALDEFQTLGRGRIQVRIINTEPTTEDATRAEQQFGIKPQSVFGRTRGAMKDEPIFLGCAITCGLEKVVVPFFDRGTPIEYELIRSIATVAQEKRKRLGVVQTDAQLFGGFDFDTGSPRARQRQPIIDELEKQYEVVQVDPSKPIEKFDALLAVQPSSLGPPQMENLLAAIKSGQPTAIFEDPSPSMMRGVPGTNEEKRGNPMMGQMPTPKGDIQRLWDFLGVKLVAKEPTLSFGPSRQSAAVVWQNWNPYPKIASISGLPNEFVFIGENMPGKEAGFNHTDPITSGLKEMWFPFPGAFSKLNASKMKFVELVTTGDRTGIVLPDQLRRAGRPDQWSEIESQNVTHIPYFLAARITGEYKSTEPATISESKEEKDAKDAGEKKDAGAKKDDSAAAKKKADAKPVSRVHPINVVLVADIDLMDAGVFALRSQTEEEDIGVHFDNIVFVLNALDALAGDNRFVEIRKRKPSRRTLTTIDNKLSEFQEEVVAKRKEYTDKYEDDKKKTEGEEAEANNRLKDLQKRFDDAQAKGEGIPPELEMEVQEAMMNKVVEMQRVANKKDQLQRGYQRDKEELQRKLNSNIRQEQNYYKFLAVLIPPIPPFLVALFVYFRRRAEEREGVAKSRLR